MNFQMIVTVDAKKYTAKKAKATSGFMKGNSILKVYASDGRDANPAGMFTLPEDLQEVIVGSKVLQVLRNGGGYILSTSVAHVSQASRDEIIVNGKVYKHSTGHSVDNTVKGKHYTIHAYSDDYMAYSKACELYDDASNWTPE